MSSRGKQRLFRKRLLVGSHSSMESVRRQGFFRPHCDFAPERQTVMDTPSYFL